MVDKIKNEPTIKILLYSGVCTLMYKTGKLKSAVAQINTKTELLNKCASP